MGCATQTAIDTFGAMKLARTIFHVDDVERAATFYERVFGLDRTTNRAEGVPRREGQEGQRSRRASASASHPRRKRSAGTLDR